jgi:hypothetical protein
MIQSHRGDKRKRELPTIEEVTTAIRQLDVEKLLTAFAALHLWNGEMPLKLLPPHLAVRRTLRLSSLGGRGHVTLAKAREVLELLHDSDAEGPALNPLEPLDLALVNGHPQPEAAAFQDAAEIVEAGPTLGGSILFVMDKFESSDPLLLSKFGFDSEDACRFVFWMLHRGTPAVSGFRTQMARIKVYGRHPHKYAGRVLLPPTVFYEMVSDALILAPSTLAELPRVGLNPSVPKFLAADLESLLRPFPSISRWQFLRRRDGGMQLIDTHILDRELPSALHWGLTESLDPSELGKYGRSIGKAFERVVAERVRRSWPEVSMRSGVRTNGQSPEIDLLLGLPGGGHALVQCKARPLSPAGRWGSYLVFFRDVEQTIFRAADQARACQETFGAIDVKANLIVLEAYFPGIPLQSAMGGTLGRALRGLNRPLVTNVFDFQYLLTKVRPSDFIGYLDWRSDRLRLQTTIPTDEFDMVRAFLVRNDARWEIGEKLHIRVPIAGADLEYEKDTLVDAEKRLEYDPSQNLLLNPPPKYLKVLKKRGRKSADALIPGSRRLD